MRVTDGGIILRAVMNALRHDCVGLTQASWEALFKLVCITVTPSPPSTPPPFHPSAYVRSPPQSSLPPCMPCVHPPLYAALTLSDPLLHESHVLWSGRQICATPKPPMRSFKAWYVSQPCCKVALAASRWSQSFCFRAKLGLHLRLPRYCGNHSSALIRRNLL